MHSIIKDNNPNPTILIVDDNISNLQILGAILQENNFRVAVAKDGYQAMKTLEKTYPDLILLDIMMPGMDGFEVCQRVKQDPYTNDIPIIFLSAKTETQDIVKGLEVGAVDYIAKPFMKEEVLARVRAHLKIGLLTRALSQSNDELKEKQIKLEEDLLAAGEILKNLLPTDTLDVPNLQLDYLYKPCESVGGDLLDVIKLDQDNLGFYILDVSGHGVSSSLVAVSVSQVMQPSSGLVVKSPFHDKGDSAILPPAEVLNYLDNQFPLERFQKFFTIFYGTLNIRTGKLTYSSAGHPFGIVLDRKGQIHHLLKGGTVIGVNGLIPFEEETVELKPGEKLILYTDGVIECENDTGEMYGKKRMIEVLQDSANMDGNGLKKELEENLENFANYAVQKDDISMLVIEYKERDKK